MNKKALLEAILFVAEKPMSLKKISSIIGSDMNETLLLLKELEKDTEMDDRGIQLIETPEGYELVIKPEYRRIVKPIAPFSDMSEGMKRTLAIVALKQPVKQSLIVRYQGNRAYEYIKKLEKRGLVKSEKFGRTKIVSLTENFEKYFGKSMKEIKEELKNMVDKKEKE